jgi:hypothetical protein
MQENASIAESLALLSEAKRLQVLEDVTEDEAAALLYDWPFWARLARLACSIGQGFREDPDRRGTSAGMGQGLRVSQHYRRNR